AALRSLRAQWPQTLVLAVPVAAPEALAELAGEVDQAVCLLQPEALHAIARWYDDFTQVSDDEVVSLLEQARQEHARELERRATG
ncbi:MAG TPA: phosphoribosyltransferase, partial [Polyangiales bacterium]|nr:phosphoribosyltransferase [Polyangiales bacterium]